MHQWLIMAALTLAMSVTLPAWSGDTDDCNNIAKLVRTEPARAVAACRRLAERGVAFAQNSLGVMYATGRGVPLDYAEAVKWYRLAAEQGNAVAQSNLGGMF